MPEKPQPSPERRSAFISPDDAYVHLVHAPRDEILAHFEGIEAVTDTLLGAAAALVVSGQARRTDVPYIYAGLNEGQVDDMLGRMQLAVPAPHDLALTAATFYEPWVKVSPFAPPRFGRDQYAGHRSHVRASLLAYANIRLGRNADLGSQSFNSAVVTAIGDLSLYMEGQRATTGRPPQHHRDVLLEAVAGYGASNLALPRNIWSYYHQLVRTGQYRHPGEVFASQEHIKKQNERFARILAVGPPNNPEHYNDVDTTSALLRFCALSSWARVGNERAREIMTIVKPMVEERILVHMARYGFFGVKGNHCNLAELQLAIDALSGDHSITPYPTPGWRGSKELQQWKATAIDALIPWVKANGLNQLHYPLLNAETGLHAIAEQYFAKQLVAAATGIVDDPTMINEAIAARRPHRVSGRSEGR